MGGHAIENAQRVQAKDYVCVFEQVKSKLSGYFEYIELVKYVQSKPDHGDVDIIVTRPSYTSEDVLKLALESKQVVRNGPVLSLEYRGHQIDLIHVASSETSDLMALFLCYGIVGMIIGMMVKSVGLKFGPKGLFVVTDIGGKSFDFQLSADAAEILCFLGLQDSYQCDQMMNDQDVFVFLSRCVLFRPSIFRHLNSHQRKRSNKRKMLADFLEWCQSLMWCERDAVKLENVLSFFGKTHEYSHFIDTIHAQMERHERVKSKFNGKIVSELTGLTGRALGSFISTFKKAHGENFDDYVLSTSEQDIRMAIQDFVN